MAKKADKILGIPQWCLSFVLGSPTEEEIEEVRQYLLDHHDVRRLANVEKLAAFSLLVRDPVNDIRYFGNQDIELLSRRNFTIILGVLDNAPGAAKLITSLAVAPADKPQAKAKSHGKK